MRLSIFRWHFFVVTSKLNILRTANRILKILFILPIDLGSILLIRCVFEKRYYYDKGKLAWGQKNLPHIGLLWTCRFPSSCLFLQRIRIQNGRMGLYAKQVRFRLQISRCATGNTLWYSWVPLTTQDNDSRLTSSHGLFYLSAAIKLIVFLTNYSIVDWKM